MRANAIARRVSIAIESVNTQREIEMIKLKQYAAPSTPTVSIESELQQLESVVIALEAAHQNPEVATLLFGSSIGLESDFGAKVKDTAKKLWEAIKAWLKKLFNWGTKTEERISQVLEETKEQITEIPSLTEEVQKQHRDVEAKVNSVDNYDGLSIVVPKFMNQFKDLPYSKLSKLIMTHFSYYGNVLFEKKVDIMFHDLYSAVNDYIKNADSKKLKDVILAICDSILDGSIPNGAVDLTEVTQQMSDVVKQYSTDKVPFSFSKSAFQVDLDSLRGDLEKQQKALANWNDVLDNFYSNLYYANEHDMREEKVIFRLVVKVARVLVDYVKSNTEYLSAAYEYRKHFSK